MKRLSEFGASEITGGASMSGSCALYIFESGVVTVIAGAALGPFAAGVIGGLLYSVSNPCNP